jgi:hypothetical protein
MHFNGFIDLPSSPEQRTKRKMRLHGFSVDFQSLNEGINRLIGLVVEQVIQPGEIFVKNIPRLPWPEYYGT